MIAVTFENESSGYIDPESVTAIVESVGSLLLYVVGREQPFAVMNPEGAVLLAILDAQERPPEVFDVDEDDDPTDRCL